MAQINSVARLKQLVRSYYKATNSSANKEHEARGRANGFIEALLMTTTVTKNQVDQIIEREHLDFFGMTREKRMHAAVNSNETWAEKNWDKFDEPAYTRRPLRCKKKK
mgnify:CR=1 FL=1